jgi:hypothetical protein
LLPFESLRSPQAQLQPEKKSEQRSECNNSRGSGNKNNRDDKAAERAAGRACFFQAIRWEKTSNDETVERRDQIGRGWQPVNLPDGPARRCIREILDLHRWKNEEVNHGRFVNDRSDPAG